MAKDPEHQRRPNPKGWTPPKAPYNPYDPTDVRPPEGYPSEYNIPKDSPSGFSSIPKDTTQYKKVNATMKKLNYTPRPLSELYPGQYKVLRKVDTNRRLNLGTRWFGTFLTSTFIIYGVFFYRWNDGYENITSDFYRARLKVKEMISKLTNEEYEDLHHPKGLNITLKPVRDTDYVPEHIRKTKESQFVLNRPAERHVLEAERIQQAQEEEMLRNEDSGKKWWAFK